MVPPTIITPPLIAGQVALSTCLDLGYFDIHHIKRFCVFAIQQMKQVGIIHDVDFYEEVTPKQAKEISHILKGQLDN